MEIEAIFAKRVKAARLAKGWSQEELAHQAGVHRTFISQIERVAKTPTLRSVAKIAAALDTKVSVLLE